MSQRGLCCDCKIGKYYWNIFDLMFGFGLDTSNGMKYVPNKNVYALLYFEKISVHRITHRPDGRVIERISI